MSTEPTTEPKEDPAQDSAPEPENMSIVAEFLLFLRENKKWWLIPMVVMILLLGALIFLGSSPVAPFIYTLF
ncbi:hypothetical protein HY256_03695 [Candidatus Sumerlaeota bacterium]|nr:hypothetical protein [Candidatus Sumerlaeota bacterium]